MRTPTLTQALLPLVALALAAPAAPQELPPGHGPVTGPAAPAAPDGPRRSEPWDAETLQLAATLPVQDGGRVKPLDTYAGFRMLRLNGKRKLELESGEKLRPTGWLLDVMFFPEQAADYACFLVQNDQVLNAIGVEPKGRRDRYTYRELAPGIGKLYQLANDLSHIEPKERDPVQRQIYKLAGDVNEYEGLAHAMEFARTVFPTAGSPTLIEAFGAEESPGVARVIAGLPAAMDALLAMPSEGRQAQGQALSRLDATLSAVGRRSQGTPALVPPAASADVVEEWARPMDLVGVASNSGRDVGREVELVAALERAEAAKGDREAFRAALGEAHAIAVELADARGEYSKVPLEVSFYEHNYFVNALVLFLAGFVFLALSWLLPAARWPVWGTLGFSVLGGGYATAGIVVRCILQGRPPVTTLYETILFVTACAVIVALAIEWINRARIGLALAPILGALGMFLSTKYELKEAVTAGDTMPSLVAVLDTNFWLATHVTSITLGYAAGLLAAALAHVWILGKLFGVKRGNTAFYKSVTRMTYGVICFGLIFSVVGTILGGIWANYSWGRFWGWDPKENGALLICLWQLLVLHARMGGYVRDHGLAVMAVMGGMVVAFSWWGVNLLGVGLHSYGFTDGVMFTLGAYYVIETLVLVASWAWGLAQRSAAAALAVRSEPSTDQGHA